jgi:aldehyde:ferredoxin oxidoreductase
MWPITYVRHLEDHVGDPTIENRLLAAVTGWDIEEEHLYRIGERIFNLQRAIHMREGRKGREDDVLHEPFYTQPLKTEWTFNPECLGPGKDGEIISKKGAVVDREKFERMKDEFYQLRGWDVASGLQTRAKLNEIDLRDIADDLERSGLLLPAL